jgi:drug/metabolite transporter (DMT)-like permease
MSMGRILINIAVVAGIAAASQSLMSTHAVWQTFWGAILAGQVITWLQGLGIALAILAVSTIGLLKMVLDKLNKTK